MRRLEIYKRLFRRFSPEGARTFRACIALAFFFTHSLRQDVEKRVSCVTFREDASREYCLQGNQLRYRFTGAHNPIGKPSLSAAYKRAQALKYASEQISAASRLPGLGYFRSSHGRFAAWPHGCMAGTRLPALFGISYGVSAFLVLMKC